ncbi:DUF4263 domain-containing protein [Paraburkholderia tropica]|uniref:Shedu anti-phage system protein SduA domain-containing protein n=1 Tax=Paraburkholderia tropica TaxID=92647 RepID=UPI001601E149|nr:Shedu anti-phage system protein SduA domain-containing protein [Paraburkholderia tropica]QNB10299.1 DUF4263 domain-containing protein [Paraburkholderia tropica]
MEKIIELVSRGAGEREIQAEFKRNLSAIAKTCVPSAIKDEYIAFSEFPIGSGSVDFAVFTDRSRMDVVLLEVKGADFGFLNADGTVAKSISDASGQIRDRFDFIDKNYQSFRMDAHSIRRRVEGGETIYNSLLGPRGYLNVDPQKDIDVWGIVIGGRTNDDYQESSARHKLERFTYRTRFESWDSWLRKYGDE